ncbi:MAG: AbrB/MazE/SpoVT family DNA-binding domain-containing protein [Armatimonadota bacterium]
MGKSVFHMRYFGSATVGERGQMVIPAEARKELEIGQGEKMIIFGRGKGRLLIVKAEMVTEFVSRSLAGLTDLERQLREESEAPVPGGDDEE